MTRAYTWRQPLVVAIALGWSSLAAAAPPRIENIEPAGAQRGVATVLAFTGANLADHPRLIAPFLFRSEPGPERKGAWTIKLTADPRTPVGVYPIRVQTDLGVSNPFLLAIGQFPQVAEKEDESRFERATLLESIPVVVEGRLDGNDVDFFRFHGRQGQRIVVDAFCARIGSGVDPSIRLTTAAANRHFVASADDSPGLETDARLIAVLPRDADYVVEIADSRYQGANRPLYRLLIGDVPIADEVYPLGGRAGETLRLELRGGSLPSPLETTATTLLPIPGTRFAIPRLILPLQQDAPPRRHDVELPGPLAVSSDVELREPTELDEPLRALGPVVFNGRIDPPGDEDRFVIVTEPGQRLHIEVQAASLGSALDGVLEVRDDKGGVIVTADDTVVPGPGRPNNQAQSISLPDPSTDLTVPGGVKQLTLTLKDLTGRGGVGYPYRLVVQPFADRFDLVASATEYSIPRTGHTVILASVTRKGYNGPITLTLDYPPPGVLVRAGIIPAGQKTGALSLSAAPDAAFNPQPVRFVGIGSGPAGPIQEIARQTVSFVKGASLASASIAFEGVTIAPAAAPPITSEIPAAPIEVAHGFSAAIPLKLTRGKDSEGAIRISQIAAQAGCAITPTTIAAKAAGGSIPVKTTLQAPLGLSILALKAEGKLQGKDQSLELPVATLNVVPPVVFEPDSTRITIKPGTTQELKARLTRKGGFHGPVTIRLAGLPAGLQCEPVTAAEKVSEAVFKIVAGPQAQPSTAKAQFSLAYKVENKDYPAPTVPLEVAVAR